MTKAMLPDGPMFFVTASCAEMGSPSITPTGETSRGINGVRFQLCFFTEDDSNIRSGTTVEEAMVATVPTSTAAIFTDRRVGKNGVNVANILCFGRPLEDAGLSLQLALFVNDVYDKENLLRCPLTSISTVPTIFAGRA